jgi:hypothetical protein
VLSWIGDAERGGRSKYADLETSRGRPLGVDEANASAIQRSATSPPLNQAWAAREDDASGRPRSRSGEPGGRVEERA